MQKRLKLETPQQFHKKDAVEYLNEHYDKDENVIHGINDLHLASNYEDWLTRIDFEKKGQNLPLDVPQSAVYFAYDEETNLLVGTIHIRYELINQKMIDRIGHIGIGIRPSMRGMGYGKELIILALEECKKINLEKALVTCNKLNIASRNTIIRCGGVLENEITITNEDGIEEEVQRFWLDCSA